ncbi:MAG: TetR family transcriptional regulator C-terminal domain-containing protein [Paracoccaceae bacterium]
MPDDQDRQAQPRKRDRDTRRTQLIEATIETLAARGYARTTLTEVARTAGLSHGLVNFHFATKEGLLNDTLAYLAEEYRRNWTEALAEAGDDPADRLDALIRADFNPAISTPARQSAWCSFWGEAQSRPIYQERCGSKDEDYNRQLEGICGELIRKGGYAGDAARFARVIRVTIEGTWLDLITMKAPYSAPEALATVHTAAAAFFPRHFGAAGRIGG